MSELHWGIKETFVGYVRRMPDGHIDMAAGAQETRPGPFAFPGVAGEAASSDGIDRFVGAVTFTGHHGMLYLEIREPWLERREGTCTLSIADDDEPGGRLDFARLTNEDQPGESATWTAVLTASGAELFFGNYTEGTPLDAVTVLG